MNKNRNSLIGGLRKIEELPTVFRFILHPSAFILIK